MVWKDWYLHQRTKNEQKHSRCKSLFIQEGSLNLDSHKYVDDLFIINKESHTRGQLFQVQTLRAIWDDRHGFNHALDYN